jgi:hypothetical protein
MSKILLVYDDFAELNATELSLKKASFDVIGLTNEYTIKDQIVSFNPDILVGFGNTQRVSSLSVAKKIKEMTRWTGKSILIFPKDFAIPADDLIRMRMDMLLETPVSVIRLIQIICKLLKQDERAVLEKLAKSFAKDRGDDLAFASFDSATVKAIQHIQGELENLDSDKSISSTVKNISTESVSMGDANRKESDENKAPTKKSFFEKDKSEPVVANVDPFVALISELNGEPPKSPSVQPTAPTAAAEKNADEENQHSLAQLGQQIMKDIENRATSLSDKVKKYTEMSADLHLYPESTIKKVKAKKELKRLMSEWNPAELEAQDQSRREFVERLFASKKDKS